MCALFVYVLAVIVMTRAQMEGDPCQVRGHSGICTEASKCLNIRKIARELNLQSSDVPRCGFTTYEEIVCCPSLPTVTGSRSNDRPAVKACVDIDAKLQPLLTPHILGGTPVELGEYPHMVAIGLEKDNTTIEYNCGGTLIAKRFVLTAAHCVVTREKPVRVRMGVVNFLDPDQMREAVEINVTRSHVYPEYSTGTVYNDIALLELQTDVPYSSNVYPTCLYTEPTDPPENATLYVSGWGVINTRTREKSDRLLKARQQIVENSKCNASITEIGRRNRFGVVSTQLCAHDPNHVKDACIGDSGGPLIMVVDEALSKFRVVGVVSYGLGCGTASPGVYARVSSYLDFIESIVWPSG